MTTYKTDFYQWSREQSEYLRLGKYDCVDWENLIEEIEYMGKSQKRALVSYLERLLDHLLKLYYWEFERERCSKHWRKEVANFRLQIKKILRDNPSLKKELEPIWLEIHPERIKVMRELFDIPSNVLISLDDALTDDWFPNDTV
ncbi:DUF29 domain-containing protein [Aphanothece hegewaldii CCALA 016]|uniref:DUF29 domain-containing protein n=1 Tax=Aphanothece hegewaldii CCALA 016 TaxID=2107694 RepID=A0A2T1LYV6_9CHRO|nr:DUF29 domain-containing protein [Aphanothece hegewaldii]PSF37590.1 DUF29 domain-containing protein [Aphanothece hegewaldii CCALA 016]